MYRFLVNLCLVAFLMGSNSVEASPVDGESLFEPSEFRNEFDMPKSCEGKSFCFDKGDDYPESTFEELLDNMPVSLNARIATNFVDNSDCPVNNTFINKPIYYILDENNHVRAVAQSSKFQQIYSVKWCQREGQITEDTQHFLKGSRTLQKYNIECVNEYYMDADFLVLSENDRKLQHARANGGIPTCCRCKYSRIGAD